MVNKEVTKESAGNYAFGYVKDKTFYIKYVGRSDTNLNDIHPDRPDNSNWECPVCDILI